MAGALGARFPALRHRNFRRYVFGQGVSLIGFWMQSVAQGWLVFRLSGSAQVLGLVVAAAFAPIVVVAPLAGVLSERVRRQPAIVATQGASMLLALGLGLLVARGAATVPVVAAFAVALGIVGAIDLPLRQAFLVEMVGIDDLPSAVAMNASIFNAARVVGPAMAGHLVATIGEAPCFILNAASYLAVLWALVGMRLPRAAAPALTTPAGKGFVSGLRYVRRDYRLGALLIGLGVVSAMSLQFSVLMPVVAKRVFGTGARGYGMLLTAFGIGAVTSALWLASQRYSHLEHRRNLLFGLVGFGSGLLGVALSPRFEMALACQVVAGFCMIRYTATTNTLIQLLVDEGYRGRVMGLHTVMFMGTSPIGSLLIGTLAERLGAPVALAVAGATPVLAAFWLSIQVPRAALPEPAAA